MTHDLESALREAREFVRIAAERAALRSVEDGGHEENRIQLILARIDAALSAASGEASGDTPIIRQLNDLLHFQNALIEAAGMPEDLPPEEVLPWFISQLKVRPVPSEAPNVERANAVSKIFGAFNGVPGPSPASAIKTALDSARAEGIAAERERWIKGVSNAAEMGYLTEGLRDMIICEMTTIREANS